MNERAKSRSKTAPSEKSNHHTLSSPCQRCKRIFNSEETLDAHANKNVSCEPLPAGELQPANEEICHTGASPDRLHEIKETMSAFEKRKILPPECEGREEELEKWAASNVDEYIGQSQTTSHAAKLELGKWFIGWYMFFPGKMIPNNPCG
jgi:hypothetical protein